MRTETDLRQAFEELADTAPDPEAVLRQLRLPSPARSRPSRRRPWIVVTAVGVVVLVVGALVPRFVADRVTAPAARRVGGNWSMIAMVDPPTGWSVYSRAVFGTYEVTELTGPTGKDVCSVELDGRGRQPSSPMTGPGQSVTVNGLPGVYTWFNDIGTVYWHYDTGAWAMVSCRHLDKGPRIPATATAVRQIALTLATAVEIRPSPLLIPIKLKDAPAGYRIGSVSQSSFSPSDWGVELEPTTADHSRPEISLGRDLSGSGGGGPVLVNGHLGTFLVQAVTGPAGPRGPASEYTSYASLCVRASVRTCISAGNSGPNHPDQSTELRALFIRIASSLGFAADPNHPSTWFDANEALPH